MAVGEKVWRLSKFLVLDLRHFNYAGLLSVGMCCRISMMIVLIQLMMRSFSRLQDTQMRKCTKQERLKRTAENRAIAEERTQQMKDRYKRNKEEQKFANI